MLIMKHHFILSIVFLNCFICFSIKASAFNLLETDCTISSQIFFQEGLTKKDVLNRIKKVAAKQFEVKVETLTMKTSFVKDFKADDLDMVELVMAFEEEFKIKIPDDQLETLTTVQKAYDYIVKVMKVKN